MAGAYFFFLVTNKPLNFQLGCFAKLDVSELINLILFLFSVKDPYFVLTSEKNYLYHINNEDISKNFNASK